MHVAISLKEEGLVFSCCRGLSTDGSSILPVLLLTVFKLLLLNFKKKTQLVPVIDQLSTYSFLEVDETFLDLAIKMASTH